MLRSRLFHAIVLGGASLASSMLACTETTVPAAGATTSGPHEPSAAAQDADAGTEVVEGDAASTEPDAGNADLDASSDAADASDASDAAQDADAEAVGRDGGWHPTK